MGSAGCGSGVHVDVLESECVVGGCNVVTTEHGRYGLPCMQKLWSA